MNDMTLRELKIFVERAVRPVRATMARKRRMREELLAHLVAIFEEEARRLGDEQAALEQAKQRFGDSKELSRQLQESVPRWDRCRSIMERLGWQSSESVWHLAAKHLLVTFLIYAAAMLVALPIVLVVGHHWGIRTWGGDLRQVLAFGQCALVLALFNAVLSVVLAWLVNKLDPVLARTRRGRISLVLLCGLMLPVAFSGAFSGAAVVFVAMVRQATEGRRYQEDWV